MLEFPHNLRISLKRSWSDLNKLCGFISRQVRINRIEGRNEERTIS